MSTTLTDLSDKANVRDMRSEWEAAERSGIGQKMTEWALKWARPAIEQIEDSGDGITEVAAELKADLSTAENRIAALELAIRDHLYASDTATSALEKALEE